MPNRSATRLPLLDGLRGLAAISVMLMHDAERNLAPTPFSHAYLAVDLFFMLSGFVLAKAFEPRFASGLGTMDFMKLRVIRLWPVIATGMLIGVIFQWLQEPTFLILPLLALSLMLAPTFTPNGLVYVLDAPVWSLACEIAANLAHALVLCRLSNRALLVVAAIFGAGLTVAIACWGSAEFGAGTRDWQLGYLRVGYAYPLGIWFGRTWRTDDTTDVPWWLALSAPVLVIMALPILPMSRAMADIAATMAMLPLLFRIASSATPPDTAVPWLNHFGELSYPVYAFNWPIIWIAAWWSRHLHPGFTPALRVAAILVTLALAEAAVHVGRLRAARRRRAASVPNALQSA